MDCIDLNLTAKIGDARTVIHPSLIRSRDNYILCDCGYPGQGDQFIRAIQKFQVNLESIDAIVLTHHDHDHVGSLAFLKDGLKGCTVAASEIEAPYIEGKIEPLRLTQAIELRKRSEQDKTDQDDLFIDYLRSIESCKVDRWLKYEETYLAPGVKIIPTPGHTEGHLSLYVEKSGTFIAGDLVVIENEKLDLAYPQYAQSLQHCLESIERTRWLSIERVLCYHGGWFVGNYQVQVEEILRKYRA